MAQHTLFQSEDVLITPKIAHFGNVTFQISNLAIVSLQEARRVNRTAVVIGLFGVMAIVVAIVAYERNAEQSLIAFAVGVVVVLGAFIVQSRWPLMEFKLTLRLSSGDTHTIVSNDRARSEQLRDAIEEAFSLRD
jgi:uncharacterized membrane protein